MFWGGRPSIMCPWWKPNSQVGPKYFVSFVSFVAILLWFPIRSRGFPLQDRIYRVPCHVRVVQGHKSLDFYKMILIYRYHIDWVDKYDNQKSIHKSPVRLDLRGHVLCGIAGSRAGGIYQWAW